MKNIAIIVILFSFCQVDAQEKSSTISYKDDVFPILRKKCLSCHNTEDESPSGLYMETYKELMSGESKHGPVILPGKGEKSILIQKLKGTASFGKPMPRGRKPLDDEQIEMIEKWINQGAKNN